ncbi:ABC transporter substrate-binding protein [Devosia limi DSM 17137]|uniref:ABC transporter substrate-binding protein n=1 Tax=Devosia limi DSM 17137 TaxID=1121477 RepID=A0A0F5LUR3_9HYPH|nr:tripartite tricarboxylate transporter substrate binding protein [Devosia limi]KKB86063.1 ABC transporter substrate-binding protein [Devosia limi DSM 17137]SHF83905.1 Tripartite-type tricarboxylate transporter, receptor component TctC [Devosia limi DSM 17137]
MNKTQAISLAAILLAGTAMPAVAQYPERPITLLVSWAAGGGTDAVARALATQIEKQLGTPVNVVNRTGGAGVIGHTEMINAQPDGYTIGLATAELATYYWSGTAEFTYEDVTPIALVNLDASAFNVSSGSEWTDLRMALDAIKAAPAGTYKLSGMAPGAGYHLALSGLLHSEGIDPTFITVVPSQGAAPGFQELASGGVDLVPSSLPEAQSMIAAGQVKSLAVLAGTRMAAFPDVPTVEEAIGKPWVAGTWRGLVAPAGVPAEAIAVLETAVEAAWNSDEFQTFMTDRGFGLTYSNSADFATFLANEHKGNGEIMGLLGLRQRD